MALIDNVRAICADLAADGWRDLLNAHGLDIARADLAVALREPLAIDRTLSGFEDFSRDGVRGIEPGAPDRSLLLHALASPRVTKRLDGTTLGRFPSLSDIDTLEDYVYATREATFQQVQDEHPDLAIVLFACEYRPASEAVHRTAAGMCFSRTGVARIGTKGPLFDNQRRGFLPYVAGQTNAFRVLPARYCAYLAVQQPAYEKTFGPMDGTARDKELLFWVPVHKLFPGPECLKGLNLSVEFQIRHVNEKLRRIHLALKGAGGWKEPDISNPPFVMTAGIAELLNEPTFSPGVVAPVVHPHLVEAAHYQSKVLTFLVPPGSSTLSSSLTIPAVGRFRHAPEYVHARHKLTASGTIVNLNTQPGDVIKAVQKGGYRAVHYLDFTGDGWIKADCPPLRLPVIAAYSLVTAPDFFFDTDERELVEWTTDPQGAPGDLDKGLWVIDPSPLSAQRIAPNLQLSGAGFDPADMTATAIVGLPLPVPGGEVFKVAATDRHSYLPDGASNQFQPGWDISQDMTNRIPHLAAYGLGSPFPEDAKLCAALSTFWPAVAPDAARTMNPNGSEPGATWPTVCPQTDDEIGIAGGVPWDGIHGPTAVKKGGNTVVRYESFARADYVESALEDRFSLALTSRIDVAEYERRVLAMARCYQAVGVDVTNVAAKARWAVLSFLQSDPTDPELTAAQNQAGVILMGNIYRFDIYRHGKQTSSNDKVFVAIQQRHIVFVDEHHSLLHDGNIWRIKSF